MDESDAVFSKRRLASDTTAGLSNAGAETAESSQSFGTFKAVDVADDRQYRRAGLTSDAGNTFQMLGRFFIMGSSIN